MGHVCVCLRLVFGMPCVNEVSLISVVFKIFVLASQGNLSSFYDRLDGLLPLKWVAF